MGVHRRLVAAAAAALVLPAGLAQPAQAQAGVEVLVVHGLPGAVVDVYADLGDGAVRLIDDFAFDGENNPFPLTLPAGAEAEVTVVDGAADEGDLSDPLIGPETVTVPDVEAVSLVAFVGADGVQLVLSSFVDPVDPTCTGNGALVFRHVAGAATTDLSLDGEVVLTEVNSGAEASGLVPSGTYEAELLFSGDGSSLLGPFDLEITAGVVTVVYAAGASNEELELLIVEYEVGETDEGDCAPEPEPTPTTAKPVPTGVPAGQGTSAGTGAVIAGVAFLGLLGTAVLVAARARRQGT
ncbi:MAG TPA: hypothetical protein VFR74_09635 [Jiangellales bacterium]|nr:hypothetical protein [Jiangellales bacterium]